MRSAPVVILPPFFQHLSGIAQCAEQCLVQAFIPEFAVEAFDEPVLLRLSGRDVMPVDACVLNPFQNRHAGELGLRPYNRTV